jgi:peptidoglycan/xylan/chitin deacetylase (PgdA/CDA1 family)
VRRGLARLGARFTRLRKRGAPRALILMYHRIADATVDPWGLCVSPARFAEHLAVLRERARPTSLAALVDGHRRGAVPDRAVVLTFDDGYADNLWHARPLLARADVPATVFVTTGYVGGAREFWWDELERLLLAPDRLPAILELTAGGKEHRWVLDRARDRDPDTPGRRAWEAPRGSRLALYHAVWRVLLPLEDTERRSVLRWIGSWSGAGGSARATHRALAKDELARLADGDLIEIGSHTATHVLLPAHAAARQRYELEASKGFLEHVLERPVTSFAYPYGEVGPESPALARAAGYDCACAVAAESVWRRNDRYRLPRFAVENWDGAELERRLGAWLGR